MSDGSADENRAKAHLRRGGADGSYVRLLRTALLVVVAVAPCFAATSSLSATSPATGVPRVAAAAGASCSGDETGPSPWSVSPSWGSGWNPAEWAPQLAGIGVANVRGFRDDSPNRGSIAAAGMSVTGFLQWSPQGGALRFPMQDLGGWAAYVRDMVTRHPEVRQWEVWNEPPNFTADPSPESYAQIVQVAYDTAKSVDPTVQIGLAAKATFVAWLAEAIEAGAAGHFDYVTLHPYERADAVLDGWEQPFLAIVPELRAMLAQVSPAQVDVPVQFTEVGIPAGVRPGQTPNTRHTPKNQAVLLAKVMTLSLAQRVQSVSWYDPFDGDYAAGEAPYGLIGLNGRPRPAFTAYANLVAALGTRPAYAGMVTLDPSTHVLVFGCDARQVLVAWTGRSGASLGFRAPVTVRDVTSSRATRATKVTLTSTPTIISNLPSSARQSWLVRAATEQEPRETPRGEVRWTAADGPDGLYVRGATRTPLRGGVEYRPAGSELQVAVDRRFLTWQRGPVEVTAVVRRVHGSPGFNLSYDAAGPVASMDWAGQRSTGSWRSVNGNRWRTITWTLPDARFSGSYGFNLRLSSDSPLHSGYGITSLSLRTLPAAGQP